MRKRLIALALATLVAGAGAPAAAGIAQPAQSRVAAVTGLPRAASCSGVWVVVDYGSLGGGVARRCAVSYTTGLTALRSAGFEPTTDEGFVYTISGKPSKANINNAYWSYWHAAADGNGGYNAWTYSTLGATSYTPKQGDAEGWRYVLISDPKTPPQASPPSNTEETPTPKPTKTTKTTKTSKPGRTSAKPSTTSSASTRASASAKATKTSSSKATRSATATASATATDTASPQTSTSPEATRATAGSDATVAQEQAGTADGSSPGSPVGVIVTGVTVVAAAGGLGGWWLLKGRKL
ncbi:hypothetical protein [Micropruina sonneratiae]|uniref:hypothetical protein n=1 Tax=Micropruina sonneratiae TaxID=2986940 RepID=UPI002226404B|nr:hypothetical protein [Micropruina sp. KQZ13P-5]MCW3156905.1 hypothetical protein [Micropruina sp. KQZ13P-5]